MRPFTAFSDRIKYYALLFIGFIWSCSSKQQENIKHPDTVTLWDSSISINDTHLKRPWDKYNCQVYDSVQKKFYPVPEEDQLLMQSYPYWKNKGSWHDQRRTTILTSRTSYKVGSTIKIIHIMEDIQTGRSVFTMGPKRIFGEFINDSLVSAPVPDVKEPWTIDVMDGETPPAPEVDYNFEISKYQFSKPGIYRIQWRMGKLVSNELIITVE